MYNEWFCIAAHVITNIFIENSSRVLLKLDDIFVVKQMAAYNFEMCVSFFHFGISHLHPPACLISLIETERIHKGKNSNRHILRHLCFLYTPKKVQYLMQCVTFSTKHDNSLIPEIFGNNPSIFVTLSDKSTRVYRS